MLWKTVYGINCTRCKKIIYVGMTSRSVKNRLKEHEADVRLRRKKPVPEYFYGNGHCAMDMGVSVLEVINDKPETTDKFGS